MKTAAVPYGMENPLISSEEKSGVSKIEEHRLKGGSGEGFLEKDSRF